MSGSKDRYCKICNKKIKRYKWKIHLKSDAHKIYCKTCNKKISKSTWIKHLKSKIHKR